MGHTGVMMSMVLGAVLSSSMKQMLKSESSTEGELVGEHYVLSVLLWGKYFIETER